MDRCRNIMFYGRETALPEDTDSAHMPDRKPHSDIQNIYQISDSRYIRHHLYARLHLTMHRTLKLTGYIGPIKALTLTLDCSSVSPKVH